MYPVTRGGPLSVDHFLKTARSLVLDGVVGALASPATYWGLDVRLNRRDSVAVLATGGVFGAAAPQLPTDRDAGERDGDHISGLIVAK